VSNKNNRDKINKIYEKCKIKYLFFFWKNVKIHVCLYLIEHVSYYLQPMSSLSIYIIYIYMLIVCLNNKYAIVTNNSKTNEI
jgi:hypothetical protein